MNGKKVVLFDLDGTINDSSPGILYCFQETGKHYGKTDIPDEVFRTGMSGTFSVNIKRIFDLEDSEVIPAITYYRKRYEETGQKMSRLFDGIKDVLDALKSKGYILGICTMTAEEYAIGSLEMYGLVDYFDCIKGASLTVLLTKPEIIDMALNQLGASNEETIFIGDGVDDYNAANTVGIDFIGVTYGYDITEEFAKKHNIDYVKEPKGILELL